MVKKNQIYVGSIKDSNNVWHPVVSSPSEEWVWAFLQEKTAGLPGEPEELDDSGFWTKTYTVEMVDFLMPEGDDYEDEMDEWNVSYERIEDEDYYLSCSDFE